MLICACRLRDGFHEACLLQIGGILQSSALLTRLSCPLSALLDSSQSLADRVRDQIFAQMYHDGIDPITSNPFDQT